MMVSSHNYLYSFCALFTCIFLNKFTGAGLSFPTAFFLHENDTSPAVCVTLTDVMAGLDREVTVSVAVETDTASQGILCGLYMMQNLMHNNYY